MAGARLKRAASWRLEEVLATDSGQLRYVRALLRLAPSIAGRFHSDNAKPLGHG